METDVLLKQPGGVVLVAEDEAQLRFVLGLALKRWSFGVIEAADGSEALEAFSNNADSITLALVDMGLPVLNGYDLILELKKMRPDLPIIVASGAGEMEGAAAVSPEHVAAVLSKPFSLDQLRSALQQAGFDA